MTTFQPLLSKVKKVNEKLLAFVSDICEILKIEVPEIIFDSSKIPTPTTLAQTSSDGAKVYFRPSEAFTPDLAAAAAHELRHVWQIKTAKDFYFENYNPDRHDITAYNLQPAEIDAHAFSQIVMTEFFHIKPKRDFMPPQVVQAIENRIPHILKTL